MFLHKWHIGLDIQDNGFYAVAVKRQRHNWQLCGWWHETVPEQPNMATVLSKQLAQWRSQLPQRLSVRIALPVHSILQQDFPLPNIKLTHYNLESFAQVSVAKLLPLPSHELCYDYTLSHNDNQQILTITAARHAEIATWQNYLNQARINAEVIDIIPCAIRCAAKQAGCLPDSLLVHAQPSQWLVISPWSNQCRYVLLEDHQQSTQELILQAQQSLQLKAINPQVPIMISGQPIYQLAQANYPAWSPFARLAHRNTKPPVDYSMYAIACGLALRPEDQ